MKIVSKSSQETYEFARRFAFNLCGGEVITLNGDLGSGKTIFAKGLATGLNVKETVTSPTFTIMNEYDGRLKLYHYDVYRLSSGDEAAEAGLTEYFSDKRGVCLIEWADNIRSVLPIDAVKISIKYISDSVREIEIDDK